MLILSRRKGQAVSLGSDIIVHVKEIRGDTVRLGFEASPFTRILRTELKPATRDHAAELAERADRQRYGDEDE